jgi:hypothetical protein
MRLGKIERVADLKNFRPPLLLRDTGTREIYALNWETP